VASSIIYSFDIIPMEYKNIYQFNPVAALVMGCATSFSLDNLPTTLLVKLSRLSVVTFAFGGSPLSGWNVGFYD
jgi:ABC-type polysaccharide/polyol phosphate export permease